MRPGIRSGSAAALVLAGVLAAGCGGSSDAARRRDAVNRYLEQVVRAQAPVAVQIARLNEAYGRFLTKRARASDLAEVAAAERRISSARAQVGGLEPPPDARRIHSRVLQLLDLERSLAHDLAWMTRYRPRLQQALEPLGPASARLGKALKAANGWDAQRAPFKRYCAALETARRELAALSAPPELRPSLVGEIATLRRSLSGCVVVDAALAAQDPAKLRSGLGIVVGAAYGPAAREATVAQQRAIRLYNGRLIQVRRLATSVEQERQRLQKRLG